MPNNIPLDEWSGAKATQELHKTIQDFVASSDASTKCMIRLTKWIARLTMAMLVTVVIQVVLALR